MRFRRRFQVWLVPVVYILVALALGWLMPRLDTVWLRETTFFSTEITISLLSSITSGMIAFTGFVFSITILLIQFGSSAYSPRLAGYLLQNGVVIHALGIFTATFITWKTVERPNSPTARASGYLATCKRSMNHPPRSQTNPANARIDKEDRMQVEPTLANDQSQRRLIGALMIAAGILVLVVALVFVLRGDLAPKGPPRLGESLGNFRLVDLQGNPVQLSDYTGRPVLVNFWATWCPPCRAEMPDLQALYQQYQDRGFVILAVNSGESRELASSFATQMGLTFPVLLDPDYTLSDQMLINSFPTSILVGRDGKVKVIHIGIFLPDQIQAELIPYLNE